MRIALWIVQSVLALAFLGAGFTKTFTPLDELAAAMPWVADVPSFLPRFIGVAEILGAVGLVLPAATRILPRLTPLAAMGLMTVMVLAAGFHVSRGEFEGLVPNAVLFALSAFVAWGRTKRAPIEPRVPTGRVHSPA
jgi:uncharacterized membrane protein YphA (DoxX/SURF4 family)